MWKPKLEITPAGAPGNRTNHGAMAHRRGMGGRKVLTGTGLLLLAAVLLAGSVFVSNRVTSSRSEIARLENRSEVLEASSARLLSVWNQAAAPSVIIARSEAELGLIVPEDPGLVLVQTLDDGERVNPLRRWLASVGGGQDAEAGELNPGLVMGSMVSLTPRGAQARGEN
jgi:hypothetical protein